MKRALLSPLADGTFQVQLSEDFAPPAMLTPGGEPATGLTVVRPGDSLFGIPFHRLKPGWYDDLGRWRRRIAFHLAASRLTCGVTALRQPLLGRAFGPPS